MKRALFVLLTALLLFTFIACDRRNTEPEDLGKMPISMNLAPAFQQGFNVTRVNVSITKGDFTAQQDMLIDGTSAGGLFEDLEMGTYAINVSVFEDTLLIATGLGTGTVSPGQTTTVYITLQFVPGGLEVVVHWGLPYEQCRRVLFVGNSHTYFNGGVDAHLQGLLDAVHPEWGAVIQARTIGGATLEQHYADLTTLSTIQTGNWDLVILQEQSSRPMNYPDLFYQACQNLDAVIAQSGALTGFYMTWAWRNNPEMYIPIRNAYNYIGAYLDGLVCPAGVAWYNNNQSPDSLDLYAPDNYHPSLNGTYLVSCLFLATIWNISPVGNHYVPAGIDPVSAAYLQNLAWTTVQGYHNARAGQKADILANLPKPEPLSPEETRLPLAM